MPFDLSTSKPVGGSSGGFDLSTSKPVTASDAPKNYTLSEVPGAALSNALPSAAKMVGGIAQAVEHPIKTAGAVLDTAAGALHNILPAAVTKFVDQFDNNPEATKRAVNTANAVGGFFKDRYGSYEAIKRTLAEDPVGAAADLSTLLSGGATLAGRSAPAVAGALKTAAEATNPMRAVVAPVAKAASVTSKGINAVANALSPKTAAYLDAAEGQGPAIINALRDPAREIIPGSKPTAAQAAASTGVTKFQGLGASAAKVSPTEYLARDDAQNAARVAAIRTIGGTPAKLSAAEAQRAAAASANYGKAFAQQVNADPQLLKMADDPYIQAALPAAEDLSKSQGVTFQSNPVQYLHNVKIALDKALSRTGDTALATGERRQVQNVKAQLVDWMRTKAPEYETARQTFADQSKPINQMEVGQFLEGKLVPALADEAPQKAAAFAAAVKDAPGTIKRATSSTGPVFDRLDQVLEPNQVKTVMAVKDDLARAARSKQMAQQPGAGGPKADQLASVGEKVLALPTLSGKVVALAGYLKDKLVGNIDRKLAIQIAAEMLDPDAAAAALEKATTRQKRVDAVNDMLAKAGKKVKKDAVSPATLAAGQASNAMAPVNTNQMNQ